MLSVGQMPSGVSLQLGAGSLSHIPREQAFLMAATTPTFPLVRLKMIESENDDSTVEVRLNKKAYGMFKNLTRADNVMLYIPMIGPLGPWGVDMTTSFQILAELGAFPSADDWVLESRKSMAKLVSQERVDAAFSRDNLLSASEGLLDAMGVLESIKRADLIQSTTHAALNERTMDAGTLIYRMGMAIYHSGPMTGRSVLEAMDDPGTAYLALIRSDMYRKSKRVFAVLDGFPPETKIHITRLIIAFAAASYTYCRITDGATSHDL